MVRALAIACVLLAAATCRTTEAAMRGAEPSSDRMIQPGAGQAGGQPNSIRPSALQPNSAQPSGNGGEPTTLQPGGGQASSRQPNSVQSGANGGQPSVSQPGIQPNSGQPGTVQPNGGQPSSGQPNSPQPSGGQASGGGKKVTASYHDYSGVSSAQTACNIGLGDKNSISAYAGSDLKCGDCAMIRNTDTGATKVVKIVDKGGAIFDLSQGAFQSLDTNGEGYKRGHLNVEYSKTTCSW